MNRIRNRLSLLLMSFVLVMGLTPAYAVAVATPMPETTAVGILAEFDLNQLPSRHAEVWFMRISLEPGGTMPMWWKSGIMLYYGESGTVTIESSGPVATGHSRAIEPEAITLSPGDSILTPEDVLVDASNTTETTATFLLLLMIFTTGDDEAERPVDAWSGFTLTRLAYGTAEFQPGPVTITLDRASVSPGETLESPRAHRTDLGYGWMGLDAGTIETGMGRATILHRSEQATIMRPDGMSLSGQYPPVKFETALTFPAGWGYFFYNAELTWTATGDEPLTILRVIVTPKMVE